MSPTLPEKTCPEATGAVEDDSAWLADYEALRLIGDVHGEIDQLRPLVEEAVMRNMAILLLGDLVDRGADSPAVVRLVLDHAETGRLDVVPGNHDDKLRRYVRGNAIDRNGEIGQTIDAFADLPDGDLLLRRFAGFIARRPLWRRFGSLFCVHAAFDALMLELPAPTLETVSRPFHRLRHIALYGAGEQVQGRVVRSYEWLDAIPADITVVIGHDILSREAVLVRQGRKGGRLIHLDTGAATGGRLSYLDLETTRSRR